MMGLYEEMCSPVDEDRDERIVNNKGKARNSPYPPRNSFPRPTSIKKSGQWTNSRKTSQDDVEDDADVVVVFIDRSPENDEQDFFDDQEDDDSNLLTDIVEWFEDLL